MAKIDINRTEIIWPGKYDENGQQREVERVKLPFQVIETINESRASREAAKKPKQPSLFDIWEAKEGDTFKEGWRNKLIWGENKLAMGSLLEKFAGKINLIYIDPPFATGADFSFKTEIGEGDLEVFKEQSLIEEKAYRDTWGKYGPGRQLDSYLEMMYERLVLMRDLLTETGSTYVHLDWRVAHYVKLIMDEIFGRDNFRNDISWEYRTGGAPSSQGGFAKKHDIILYYSKSDKFSARFRKLKERIYYEKPFFTTLQDEKGRYYADVILRDVIGGELLINLEDRLLKINAKPLINVSSERLDFDTQKPEGLLQILIMATTEPGDLIADIFCGSGTTLAMAEKLDRRWIGCDLSRWAIHVTRKRLLDIENCKPFELLNLGKYERQYWQDVTFGKEKKTVPQVAIFQYIAFILKLYGAQPITGMQHLHGKKENAVVHIGAVDAPVTIDEVLNCIEECVALKQKELHVLGWEWEMGLYNLMVDEAKSRGVKLVMLAIPREVMEQQAVDRKDIHFFELAYLEVDIQQQSSREVVVALKDFVIHNTDLIPEDVRNKIKKWSDYIDYWAVDWDFRNDTFMNGWVTYRKRKDRTLLLKTDPHVYEQPGKYTIMIKVIDIFGNDTSQAFEMEVK